jgi:deoxyribodipyrimidine photo-lyase
MTGGVVWFRNDLRLRDNPAWAEATGNHHQVTALFVVDPQLWDRSPPRRRQRLEFHLAALDRRLMNLGGRLRIESGSASVVVPTIADGGRVYWNSDVAPYARRRDAAVASVVEHSIHDGRWIIPVGSVRTGAGGPFRVFTPFFNRWRDQTREPWPEAGGAAVLNETGNAGVDLKASIDAGEDAARDRLDRFLDEVDGYSQRRDIPSVDGTSRLSEDLKFGTISPRVVERRVGASTEGRAAFVRQLAWREFCAQLLVAYPDMATRELRSEYSKMRWRDEAPPIAAWKQGQTGYPIVDAGMRQLSSEGWMHNRLRMITASFLIKDLLVDWRIGERHFHDLLLDFDPAQNAANWQWVAGTGADAAPYFRVFNPLTQAARFDPDGDYVRRWVPELSAIMGGAIHTPWKLGPLELAAAGVELGTTYPFPMVDHAEARLEAIAAYEAARAI